MKPLTIIAALLLNGCQPGHKQLDQDESAKSETKVNYSEAVNSHFKFIDSVRNTDDRLIAIENEKFEATFIHFGQNIFQLNDTFDFNKLIITKSSDKQLCLASWDTRMKRPDMEYTTMAFFKTTNGEVKTKRLINDTIYAGFDKTLLHFNTVYTVRSEHNVFYLALGYGKDFTSHSFQQILAFAIQNDQLTNPIVFPENLPYAYVDFNSEFHGEMPVIRIEDSAKKILIPMFQTKNFSVDYDTLVFNGKIYKRN